MTGIIVRVQHARAARLDRRAGVTCAPGLRAWCKRYGIDLHRFLACGMPIEEVEAIPDAFAQRAAAIARAAAMHGDRADG